MGEDYTDDIIDTISHDRDDTVKKPMEHLLALFMKRIRNDTKT